MRQIRARIREKRGVDYTEQQIRELAAVKLERFLDPEGARSELLEQFRRGPASRRCELRVRGHDAVRLAPRSAAVDPPPAAPGPQAVLQPEPADPGPAPAGWHQPRHAESTRADRTRLLHNLVLEMTRLGVEVKNLKMRVESLSGRLDFAERRSRAVESRAPHRAQEAQRRTAGPPRAAGRAAPPAQPAQPTQAGTAAQPAEDKPRRELRPVRPRGRRRPATATGGQREARRRKRRGADGEAARAGAPARRDRRRRAAARHRRRRGVPQTTVSARPSRTSRHDDPEARAGSDAAARRSRRAVKLAVVVQRYGTAINGGAELHARHVAEHLARHADVEVLTTCARDYVTWRNELPPGPRRSTGSRSAASRYARPRSVERFGRWSARVFNHTHSVADELAWLDAEGPTSPALIGHVRANRAAFDFFLFFSYRYYHAYHGARAAPDRAVLVPTAEREPTIGVSLFKPLLAGVRGLVYLTPEERDLMNAASGNAGVPGDRRGQRFRGAGAGRAGAVPPEVRHRRAVRDLRRADRPEQGVRRAVRVLRALRVRSATRSSSCCAATRSCRSPTIRASGTSASCPTRTSSTAGGGRPAGHAVVLREPVDGGARGVGARHGRCSPTRGATC